jgi:tetratricopeptide (TPR) repeat protein
MSGVVHGPAVQARNIQGDVHFSLAQPRSSRMPVPAQLPPVPANFTDRVEELDFLDRVTSDYDPMRRLTVIVITGIGGTGKTSLGSYWLHRASDSYEGGALYADLGGHQPDAAARPGDVLAGFLRSLGTQPEQVPLTLEEQAALYRSVTSGRRMLILLDNAASAAQVRALMPGPGPRPATETPDQTGQQDRPTVVIVTSRWHITGLAAEGAHFIEIGSLDDASATALFDRIVGIERVSAEKDAVRSIVRLCGGLPLAICVAGAHLALHVSWPVSRIARELASEQRRLAALSIAEDLSVRSTFDASYKAMPAEVSRLYRLLSLVPGPDFGPELASAAAGANTARAAGMLDALVQGSLLEETGYQRFRFHDLVKLHAREQAQAEPEDDLQAALVRIISWYLRQAIAADIVIIPGRWRLNPMYDQARTQPPAHDSPAEALRWLESEQPGLSAAVQAAHDKGLHQYAWQLCEALWALFSNRNYFRPWIEAHQLGIASAQADGNRRAEARMRMQLGLAYLHLGRYSEAREQYTLALALDRSEGHQIGEATELEQLGLTDLAEGQPDEAIQSFARARDIFDQIDAPRGAAMMTCHIGEAHRDAGRYPDAIRDLTQARQSFAMLPDQYNEARALTELGLTYLRAGRPYDAFQSLGRALDTMTSLDSRYEQARIRVVLAGTARELGHHHQVRSHLVQALAVYDGLGAPEADEVRRLLVESAQPDSPDADDVQA